MFLTKLLVSPVGDTASTSALYVIGKDQTNVTQLTAQAQAQGYTVTNTGGPATTLTIWKKRLQQAAGQEPSKPPPT